MCEKVECRMLNTFELSQNVIESMESETLKGISKDLWLILFDNWNKSLGELNLYPKRDTRERGKKIRRKVRRASGIAFRSKRKKKRSLRKPTSFTNPDDKKKFPCIGQMILRLKILIGAKEFKF